MNYIASTVGVSTESTRG